MSRNLHPPVDKHRHCNNSLSNSNPRNTNIPTAIFLPFIAALTSATCGGIICHFSHAPLQLQVPAIVAYLQVGAGVALATYFNCSSPTADTVCQDMIFCGPYGQESFAFQVLDQAGKFLTAHAAGPVGFIRLFFGLLSGDMLGSGGIFAIIRIFIGRVCSLVAGGRCVSVFGLVFDLSLGCFH
ncbi:malic acid transport protein [Penicillium canescens]|nr:malic acid transport protein [Penicillium canescens]